MQITIAYKSAFQKQYEYYEIYEHHIHKNTWEQIHELAWFEDNIFWVNKIQMFTNTD